MGKHGLQPGPFYQDEGLTAVEECPHQHFKTRAIDRDLLTRKQHLNLLCTPRGYRWEVAYILEQQQQQQEKEEDSDFVCQGEIPRPAKTYVYNILADLLTLLTPQMIDTIRDMIVEEFGLSRAEAEDFICIQVRDIFEKAVPPHLREAGDEFGEEQHTDDAGKTHVCCKNPLNVKPCLVKQITKTASDMMAQIAHSSMCGKRDKRHKTLTYVMHERLCEMTQDTFDYDNPRTVSERAQAFLIDKMALWICENIRDEDAEDRRLKMREDEKLSKAKLAKEKEREDRKKEREKLLKAVARQRQATAAMNAENKKKLEEEKEKRDEERKKKHEEWLKRDEENKKKEEARRKEERAKMKEEAVKKKEKEAKMKEEIAKQNEGLRNKHEKAKQAKLRAKNAEREQKKKAKSQSKPSSVKEKQKPPSKPNSARKPPKTQSKPSTPKKSPKTQSKPGSAGKSKSGKALVDSATQSETSTIPKKPK